MKVVRKVIEIDEDLCDGCGNCVPSCAEGALEIIDGKAKVIADIYCDGLGACLGECPTGALSIVQREADDFDDKAVEAHLAKQKKSEPQEIPFVSGGCPSARIQSFEPSASVSAAAPQPESAAAGEEVESALSHWPVQIMLVPPTAPFLKGADLLVLADCVPVAFPTVHRDFLKGKAVMMGCPKFLKERLITVSLSFSLLSLPKFIRDIRLWRNLETIFTLFFHPQSQMWNSVPSLQKEIISA